MEDFIIACESLKRELAKPFEKILNWLIRDLGNNRGPYKHWMKFCDDVRIVLMIGLFLQIGITIIIIVLAFLN